MGNTVKSSQQLTTKKKKKALQPRLSTDILLEGLLELIYVYTEIDLHRMWVHACTFGSGLQHQLLQKMWYTCRRCLYSKSCSHTTVSLSHTSFSEDIVLQLQSVDLSSSTVHSFSQPLLCSSIFYSSVCIDICFASMYYCQYKTSTKTYNLAQTIIFSQYCIIHNQSSIVRQIYLQSQGNFDCSMDEWIWSVPGGLSILELLYSSYDSGQ